MKRPTVLPLPGNSTKEQSFYEVQGQPAPGVEWPGSFELDQSAASGTVVAPDPKPFKLDGES